MTGPLSALVTSLKTTLITRTYLLLLCCIPPHPPGTLFPSVLPGVLSFGCVFVTCCFVPNIPTVIVVIIVCTFRHATHARTHLLDFRIRIYPSISASTYTHTACHPAPSTYSRTTHCPTRQATVANRRCMGGCIGCRSFEVGLHVVASSYVQY